MTTKRDVSLDSLKGLLILLVVLGHVIAHPTSVLQLQSFLPVPIHTVVYKFINSFHMAVFVFLSGYFSKRSGTSAEQGDRLVKSVFIPFVVFQIIHTVLFKRTITAIFQPGYSMWYLLSLFYWRLLVRPISRIRFALPISIVLALICGLTPTDRMLSASRTITFFPFFLAGYLTDQKRIDQIRCSAKWKPITVIVVCLMAAVVMTFFSISSYTYFMEQSYTASGFTPLAGIALRSGAILVGFMMIYALLALPFHHSKLMNWGQHSIVIYLGQSIFVQLYPRVMKRLPISAQIPDFLWLLLAVIIAVSFTWLAGSDWAYKWYQRVMTKITGLLIISDPESASTEH